ncbi:MAG: ribonuclease Y [Chlamydiales bacterium]
MNSLILSCLGFAAGLSSFYIIYRIKKGGFQSLADAILLRAEVEAETRRSKHEVSLKEEEYTVRLQLEKKGEEWRQQKEREEKRLQERNDRLEERILFFEKQKKSLDKREEELREKMQATMQKEEELLGLSREETKRALLVELKAEVENETLSSLLRIKKEKEEEAEVQASKVISTAINRLAHPIQEDAVTTTVALPNDEMKRRIIGREGKNIRALEKTTGVNFLIDETPHAIVISSFDPIRKEIAKETLKLLLKDGRIHPTRIEEVVERVRKESKKRIKERGEEAAMQAKVMGLHPELIVLLGQLGFRYSYGQNVLEHSVEVSRLMRMMAEELGLDANLAKRIGLLHDIGKVAPHDVEGSHALIGHDFALKYGESKEVANGIGCHHNEIAPLTVEGSLCSAADTLSGGRPGARIESVENYIQRLQKLEVLAQEFPGVERSFALSSGRELRVIVNSSEIGDTAAAQLARTLAKRVEEEMSYPGKIKVTVIREQTTTVYAL